MIKTFSSRRNFIKVLLASFPNNNNAKVVIKFREMFGLRWGRMMEDLRNVLCENHVWNFYGIEIKLNKQGVKIDFWIFVRQVDCADFFLTISCIWYIWCIKCKIKFCVKDYVRVSTVKAASECRGIETRPRIIGFYYSKKMLCALSREGKHRGDTNQCYEWRWACNLLHMEC